MNSELKLESRPKKNGGITMTETAQRFKRRMARRKTRRVIMSAILLMTAMLFTLAILLRSQWAGLAENLEKHLEYMRIFCSTRDAARNTIIQATNVSDVATRPFQVIVLTYDRPASLQRCLESTRKAEYDGKRIDLAVWVDRSTEGVVNDDVIKTARDFAWPHGTKTVHVWNWHVGIWGQWIDSFEATDDNDSAVILEDDLELSPFYFRWLQGARNAYGKRNDVFGYTLQRGTLRAMQTGFGNRRLSINSKEKAFFYLLVGSWGYAPEARVWREFRKWFHEKTCTPEYKPYVEGLVPTKWYKRDETRRSMWTMWHIRYAHDHKLYTVYANLADGKTLAANWREKGLHFSSGGGVVSRKDFDVLERGKTGGEASGEFSFPPDPRLVDWNGTYIGRNGKRTKK